MTDLHLRRVRRYAALTLLLASAACGGGGAVLPTEPGTDLPGDGGEGPVDPPPGGGGGGGGGGTPGSITVAVAPGEDGGFSPGTITIVPGTTVVWQMVDEDHDVTFDGARPAGGDIPETEEEGSASRTFDQPGTYDYHCEEHADDEDEAHAGTVIVTAGSDDPTDPGNPPSTSVSVRTPGDSFSPATATIPAGGTVQWQISGDQHNVTFTGAAPPGGNIPTTEGTTTSRTFPTAGRFDYFCTRHSGMTGAVVVQ